MEIGAEQLYEQAIGHFRAGATEETGRAAEAFVSQASGLEAGWFLKALAAAAGAGPDGTWAALEGWRGEGGNTPLLAAKLGRFLLEEGRYDILLALFEGAPGGADHHFIWLYFAGCARMMEGDMDGAFAHFDAFRGAIGGVVRGIGFGDFIEHHPLNLVLRQGRLTAGTEEVARRIEAYRSAPPAGPEIEIAARVPDADAPLFLTCCNGVYFSAMGRDFVDRLLRARADAAVHVHVAAPGTDTDGIVADLTGRHPGRVGLSVTAKPPFPTATYFTCERFFVAERLLEARGRAIVSLDLDVTPSPSAPDFHALAESHDFCCYDTGRTEPASVCQASVLVWGTGAGEFLRALQAYCWPGLTNPSSVTWMLDQAALFSVRHYFRRARPEIRFGEIGALSGRGLEESLETFVTEDHKFRLRALLAPEEPTEIKL